jgi:uncharacterized repeat protein (TIGR03803 family)
VRGTFYGTTEVGGLYGRSGGTVFAVTTGGKERVLHSFGSGTDGQWPEAGLIDVGGTLYGTTIYGGAHGLGTVFSITTTGGTEKVLHSFGSDADGAYPFFAELVNVRGTLYGTTSTGGAHGHGTVFSITTGGIEHVVYSFVGGPRDGATPFSGLVNVGGKLYGTTYSGGTTYSCGGTNVYYGCGTVFSITSGGKEKVLHSFGGGGDGVVPYAGLVNVRGVLYGTTTGGGSGCGGFGCGTVYAFQTAGSILSEVPDLERFQSAP